MLYTWGLSEEDRPRLMSSPFTGWGREVSPP